MFTQRQVTYYWVLFLLTFFNCEVSLSQKKQSDFSSQKLQTGCNLEIQRSYIVSKKDTVLVDQYDALLFGFSADSISTVSRTTLNLVLGKPEGDYYAEHTRFTISDAHPSYKNFRVLQTIRGSAHYTYGKYRGGIPIGSWNQYTVEINDRKLDTLEVCSFRFDNRGYRVGLFEWKNIRDNLSFKGEFKENMPDGNWEFTVHDDKAITGKIRFTFVDGLLTQISSGDIKRDFISSEMEDQVDYFLHEVIQPYLRKSRTGNNELDSLVAYAGNVLSHHAKDIFPVPILPYLSFVNHQAVYPQIILPIFALDNETEAFISELIQSLKSLQEKSEQLLNKPEIVLAAFSNKELAEELAKVQLLNVRLNEVSGMMETMQSTLLKHLDWKDVLQNGYFRMSRHHTVLYDSQNRIFELKRPIKDYDENNTLTANWTELIDWLNSDFHSATDQINKFVVDKEKNKQLDELQTSILRHSRKIDSLLNTTEFPELNFVHTYKNGVTQFRNLLIQRFNEFDEAEQLVKGPDIVNQYEKFVELVESTPNWIRMHEYIDMKYHYLYLDPNTFVERIELLYDHLFSAYIGKLMPFVMNELNFKFNHVDEFEKSFQNINLLQQRMISILDENARLLNRKIKRGDSPSKILEKLNLILN